MKVLPQEVVTLELFLSRLEDENSGMKQGTEYRQMTAKMALGVAKKVRQVEAFETRERAYNTLKSYLTNVDEDRLRDVAKFLYVILNEMLTWMNLPDYVRKLLAEKEKKT